MSKLPDEIRTIIEKSFYAGFSVSREGFNYECTYNELSPSGLGDVPTKDYSPALDKLLNEWIDLIKAGLAEDSDDD